MSPGKSDSLVMVCERIARAGLCHVVGTGGTARKKPVSVALARKQAICRSGPLDMFLRIMTQGTVFAQTTTLHKQNCVDLFSASLRGMRSAPQRGARTLVLNTIAHRVAVDIRREAYRTANTRAAAVNVCTVGHGVCPQHQGFHLREACQCMNEV